MPKWEDYKMKEEVDLKYIAKDNVIYWEFLHVKALHVKYKTS